MTPASEPAAREAAWTELPFALSAALFAFLLAVLSPRIGSLGFLVLLGAVLAVALIAAVVAVARWASPTAARHL